MADKRTNYLNEEIKRREAEEAARKAAEQTGDEPMKLDDTQRVKVLSPGRLVSKRFFRNKLALVGLAILIALFLFCFVGPLFYPYSQTDIFYKYDYLTINYGMATERTEYTNYTLDAEADIHYSVRNKMTSYISTMESKNLSELEITDDNGVPYVITRLGEGVYSLSAGNSELVATLAGTSQVGEFNKVSGVLTASVDDLPEGIEAAATAAVADGTLAFTLDGCDYTLTVGSVKVVYNLTRSGSSLEYEGSDLGEEFETAFYEALEEDQTSFEYDGKTYYIAEKTGAYEIMLRGEAVEAMLSSVFVFDAYEVGSNFSDEFKTGALLAVYGEQSFAADGETYTITEDDGNYYIFDAQGGEVAMMSTFVVRRYSGDDTLSLAFKQTAAGVIAEMEQTGATQGSFVFSLPEMDDNGVYLADENGNLTYADREIIVTRQLDSYVLRCEQITNLIDIYAGPTREHPFGTDADGMDILARMMYGGRISLMVGFVVVIMESVLGVILGGIAGFFGGWVDTLIMRMVDIFYCIPTYPILIIMGAFFDAAKLDSYTRLLWMMVVLGVLGWAGVARLVRGQILSLREQEFMVAAEATGIRARRRIFRHLIPNVMPQLIVSATMGLGSVIITESTLSFLGLGVKRPLATWGTMINSITSSNENLVRYAYIWIPVGLLICLAVIAFNFVGDGLRDAFDPKMKQ